MLLAWFNTVFPRVSARHLIMMSAFGWALIGRSALSRGGLLWLSSPVGNQAYLSSIVRFSQRVINIVAIETGFPCTLTIKKWWEKGRGGGGGAPVWYSGLRSERLFGEKRSLERARLFEEIRYLNMLWRDAWPAEGHTRGLPFFRFN